MAFFDNLMASLKQKWLQFFQENRSWLTLQMEVESVYTPDGGKRPSSYLILGAVNALEPELGQLMLPFSQLNPAADALIEVLELNFDPNLMLGNRFNLQEESLGMSDDEVATMLQQSDYMDSVIEALTEVESDLVDEMLLDNSDDETIVVLSATDADVLSDILLDEIADETALPESDNEFPETPRAAQLGEIGDTLPDVWGEETSSESKQAGKRDT